jgi:type II secretory pathway pseudopilin PulG
MIAKGAMFGLDARIALAIFGALSVISGAALYSAIKDAKVTAFITEVDNISKAYEQYLLDTGVEPVDQNYFTPKMSELVVNDAGVSNWNGPYLPYTKYGTVGAVTDSKYFIDFRRTSNESWGLGHPTQTDIYTNCESNCYIYLDYNGVTQQFIDDIETKIDGTIDYTQGRVRSLSSTRMHIRLVPSLKQSSS